MLKNSGFPLCYQAHGNKLNPCIILIMGIGGQLIDWPSVIIQGLIDTGFYVVTFDNRDSGLSHYYDELGEANFEELIAAKQQSIPFMPPYTLEDMAEDVIVLMDELEIAKARIVGISMGGIIAQYVAMNHIERTEALICIASTSGDHQLPPPKKEVLEHFSSSLNSGSQSSDVTINRKIELYRIYNHPYYFDVEKARKQIMTSLERANNPAGFKRQLLAMTCAEPRTTLLKQLNVPALIIHGDYDPVFPLEHGRQLAACIAGGCLKVITKMGHGLPDHVCKQIVELIAGFNP